MQSNDRASAALLGVFILLGLAALGWLVGAAAIEVKQFERTVAVKGLSEREYPADLVVWPIQFTAAGNDLSELYGAIEDNVARITAFLRENGIDAAEISTGAPSIMDRSAQPYGGPERAEFRYTGLQTVTVYSTDVAGVQAVMSRLSALGKQGIVLTSGMYPAQTEYLFTRLNAVKPEMIEEATRNAREVAEKFAADSSSRLGKIRRASQGQFSIEPRDMNNPQIKRVRVVSTIEYYLSD